MQFPTNDESFVDAMFGNILKEIATELGVERLPEYAQEDARDIINELQDDLAECKEILRTTQSMLLFKACVHQDVEDARDRIWEFKRTLYSSSSIPLSSFIILIFLKLISALF